VVIAVSLVVLLLLEPRGGPLGVIHDLFPLP
jgi:hypothetical protein